MMMLVMLMLADAADADDDDDGVDEHEHEFAHPHEKGLYNFDNSAPVPRSAQQLNINAMNLYRETPPPWRLKHIGN